MSLKIEKTGLFAIKEKTGARMRTVVADVSPHVHTTRTCTHACDTRTLARAAAFAAAAVAATAAVEISRRKTRGAILGHTLGPSFLSPRWFNEPIRRSFLPAVLPTFFPYISTAPRHSRTVPTPPNAAISQPSAHHRVMHPFVACPRRISPGYGSFAPSFVRFTPFR